MMYHIGISYWAILGNIKKHKILSDMNSFRIFGEPNILQETETFHSLLTCMTQNSGHLYSKISDSDIRIEVFV